MANPLTAINADVDEQSVNTLVTNIMKRPDLCEITLLSRGMYGFVFSIRLYEEMGEQIDNPFDTFTFGTDGTFINTSYATDEIGEHSTFCCKLVPILETQSPIEIILLEQTEQTEQTAIQQETSTKLAFNNECNKQRQIYALTNHNLNSVCLPLFYFDIVSLLADSIRKRFIQFIFQLTDINIPLPPLGDLHFGISFMPLSPNTDSTTQQKSKIPPSIAFITREDTMRTILDRVRDSYLRQDLDEPRVIEIFQGYPFIYSFVSIVSLLMRLYSVGYCHGDLHDRNIVVYPNPSGMIDDDISIIYFAPTITLIDTGFAYKHGKRVPGNFSTNYESFKLVIMDIITTRAPKLGQNMRTHEPYRWFPKVFMGTDEIHTSAQELELNEDICRVIFILFQYHNTYRNTFETHQLRNLPSHTVELTHLREQNKSISRSVVTYIQSLTSEGNPLNLFNVHGGRRNLRSRYRHFTRKKTNKNRHRKKHPRKSRKRGRK
jgi:hypothetical protein